ncbi:NAD(P)H-hydrate dehydratase [Pedobacter psychroterrae]|uniref:ADP-dependent (S)-NAD(P)H-hydrate dehydratase n=1 Tax=Pedobacter psychroterrae TaxID=2530453 RepID=A0A4R0NRS5_9SPHI|nr:NAD(P)H-hydrate dehydratase [Pedobacter psychroterrae]TCD03596.1 NAD(P)H-hydrate dehydratase [Pedobacter psychroterrae]
MADKLSAFLPDSDSISKIQDVSRGLSAATDSPYRLIQESDISALIRPRLDFSHKGTYGHALIIAGERATMGAALLASSGCLYAGAGLTTACIPESGLMALNVSLPEVMYLSREKFFEQEALNRYNAVAIGPGVGITEEAVALLSRILELKRPVIADADALNLLASNSLLMQGLVKGSILTPHMKEFDRLFGIHETWYSRLQTARERAAELGIVIVLKNQYTFIIDADGTVYINSTGSPAMAQGGMGDVLTGIIAAYIAQGYAAKEAAILGCFFHGAAGSELAKTRSNVRALEVAEYVPKVPRWYVSD